MAITDIRYGVVGDLGIKAPCRVATTGNITLSGLQTIDGVTVERDDRVLVKDQADGTENGIYNASTTEWKRAADFNGARDAAQGTLINVVSGSQHSGTVWQLLTSDPTIGTDSLSFDFTLNGNDVRTVNSVSDLQSGSYPSYVSRLWLSGYYGVGTPGGGPFYDDPDDTTTADNGGTVIVDADGRRWKAGAGFVIAEDVTVNVPTDFSTLQAAIDYYSEFTLRQGVAIALNIESGHDLTSGLSCISGDFSSFVISSVDAEVSLDAGFTPVTVPDASLVPDEGENPILYVENATGPTWDILVDATGHDGAGCTFRYSRGTFTIGSGVKNADRRGLFVSDNSSVFGHGIVFSGSGESNRVTTNSFLDCPGCDFSGMRDLSASGNGALDVSRGSVVNMARNAAQSRSNLSNSSGDGLTARRSWIAASRVDVSGASGIGIQSAFGSHIAANDADASGVGFQAVFAEASTVDVTDADLSGAGVNAIRARDGANVAAAGSNCSNASDNAVEAEDATVDIQGANCDSSGNRAISAIQGARVMANAATLTNANDAAVFANKGAHVDATDSDVTGFNSGATGADAVEAFNGSIVAANAMSGTPTFNLTTNSVTANGIIFN